MKERPVLFNAPMVRAILAGDKTQTRRIMKPQPSINGQWPHLPTYGASSEQAFREGAPSFAPCPYGQVGDRLWVRETWRGIVEISPPDTVKPEYGVALYVPAQEHCKRVEYAATGQRDADPWRPSIHMPRWASRILLEITGVRVERLQDIREGDARAEGVTIEEHHKMGYCAGEYLPPSIRAFRDLWTDINGTGSWDANPWVWVIGFRRVE
ncbi:hypothetical protein [Herbaspirillum seropedicae]|uniref:hypothetical protein n=1 Tax=Herbaspirillum seropedicae TaxID=964 RepID=UPI00285960D5|nr:hypothetical protein [Herbaspirillum seropedicae]MDR6394665.1 hypothetical protein [Herbaspirillum seropedicae]